MSGEEVKGDETGEEYGADGMGMDIDCLIMQIWSSAERQQRKKDSQVKELIRQALIEGSCRRYPLVM